MPAPPDADQALLGATSPEPTTPTYLDWLRARDDDWLSRLLLARPDVARPAPPDTATLVARLSGSVSINRALDRLDAAELQVVEVLSLLPAPTGTAELAAALPDADPAELVAAVHRLRELALVWSPGGPGDGARELQLLDPVIDLLRHPAGLGRSAHALTAPGPERETVLAAGVHLPDLDPGERALLDRLAQGPPIGVLPAGFTGHEDPPGVITRLLSAGLLIRVDVSTVELPREVAMAVRGERPYGPFRTRPAPAGPTVDPGTLDKVTAGAVLGVVQKTEDVLAALDDEAAGVLRSGGLGVREVRRLGKSAQLDEATVYLILEFAFAAELLGIGPDGEHWLPTRRYDAWLAEPPGERWATLAEAWLQSSRQAGLSGQKDSSGRALPPLSAELIRHAAATTRRAALDPLLATDSGEAWTSDELIDLVSWTAPRRGADHLNAARDALAEARLLGVIAQDALSAPGRALLVGSPDLGAAAAKVLPDPIEHILVQPDLSAIAPGPLVPELARSMGLAADVESSGGATVYRISESSLRRALDAGWSSTDLHELFAKHSRTPVPQTLDYLIDDISRRHGGVRVGTASAYLRSDDHSTLAQVAADRRLSQLGLRQLAPGVLITSRAEPEELLVDLRAAGYAPAAESAGGAVLTGVAARPRAAGRRASPAPRPIDLTAEQRWTVVSGMRAGDVAAQGNRRRRVIPAVPGVTTSSILTALQRCIRDARGVWMGYVNAEGQSSQRLVEPVALSGGYLTAYDHRRDETRTFALHRITSISVAEE